jgi:aspartate carbamoyltransferase regulatory subunit
VVELVVKLVRVFDLNLKEKYLTILEIFCYISAILTLITAILNYKGKQIQQDGVVLVRRNWLKPHVMKKLKFNSSPNETVNHMQ